jgi:hypothetical protein
MVLPMMLSVGLELFIRYNSKRFTKRYPLVTLVLFVVSLIKDIRGLIMGLHLRR